MLLVAALVLGPGFARAQDDDETEEAKPKKKSKVASDAPRDEEAKSDSGERGEGEESEAEEAESDPLEKIPALQVAFPPRRYNYILGGAFFVGGLAFAFSAQGEAKRSDTITSAVEAQNALVNARASAATASVLYAFAAATLAYALMLEFLPEPVAEKAALTFHF